MAPRRLPFSAVVVATLVALAAAVGVYAVLAGSGGGDGGAAAGEAETDRGAAGEPAPTGELPGSVREVRLAALDGGPDRTLGDFVGQKPVVLNFFASWCVPCLEEMPAFEAVHQDLGDRVAFVGLATQDAPERASAMVERTGVTYPSFGDPDSSGITYFGVTNMPATVFIDATGEVVDVANQPFTEDELRQLVAEHLGVSP